MTGPIELEILRAVDAVNCGNVQGNTARRNIGKWRNDAFGWSPEFVTEPEHVSGAGQYFVVAARPPGIKRLTELARAGWTVTYGGRWPILRREGVTVRWFGSWVGERELSVAECEATWAGIVAVCARYGSSPPPPSPAMLGRELWLRGLARGVTFPTPTVGLAEWVRSVSHQGRVELLRPQAARVPAVYEYDARTAYLAVLTGLPAGDPYVVVGEQCRAIDSFAPSRQLVAWSAPAGWDRCGIFRQDDGYPLTSNGPEWADGAEVHLARRYGWHVRTYAAVVWPERRDPFRGWLTRIERVRFTPPAGVSSDVWAAVWRGVELQTIGALYGSPSTSKRMGPDPELARGHIAERPREVEGGGVWRWTPAGRADTGAHPEWAAAIWARARVRLLDAPNGNQGDRARAGAWNLPAADVIGFRTDAIYTTGPVREWVDDGAAGRYRLARFGPGRPWPLNQAELTADLVRVAR